MKSKHSAILAVFITTTVILGFVMFGGANYINNVGGSNPAGNTVFTPQPAVQNVPYTGTVAFLAKGSNIGNGTNLTADTNFDVEYFKKSGDVYNKVSVETDGTENFAVGADDVIYGQVTIPASQIVYLDWDATLKANPSGVVKKPAYIDITKDGVIDYLFPLDITLTKQQGYGNPNLTPAFEWFIKFHGDQVLSLDAPANKASVGTGTKSTTITWQGTMDHQPGAEAVKAFQITVNGTRATNEVAEEQSFINFPFASESNGYKKIYFSDPGFSVSEDFTSGSTKTIMRYTISSQIDGADFIVVDSQGSKSKPIDVTVETNMDATNDGVCLELRIEPISARNVAGTAITDDVELAEGAVGNACSV